MQCSSRMLHRRKGRKGLCIRPVRCRGTACLWACNVTVLHTCACAAAAAWPLQDRGAHEAAAAVRRSRPKRVGVPVRLGDDGLRADCLAVHRRNRRRRNQLAHACAPPVREVSGRARSAASPEYIVPVGAIDRSNRAKSVCAMSSRRCNPPIPVPKVAVRVHGLCSKLLAREPPFADVARALVRAIPPQLGERTHRTNSHVHACARVRAWHSSWEPTNPPSVGLRAPAVSGSRAHSHCA